MDSERKEEKPMTNQDQNTERCLYCGADISAEMATPPLPSDDDGWQGIVDSGEHYPFCEWIATRAHSKR